jgi:hypothetical protein
MRELHGCSCLNLRDKIIISNALCAHASMLIKQFRENFQDEDPQKILDTVHIYFDLADVVMNTPTCDIKPECNCGG